LSLELVLLPAAYATDAALIIRTAAKLVSVKFRMKNSSEKLDRACPKVRTHPANRSLRSSSRALHA
jgi:hypothetical protein